MQAGYTPIHEPLHVSRTDAASGVMVEAALQWAADSYKEEVGRGPCAASCSTRLVRADLVGQGLGLNTVAMSGRITVGCPTARSPCTHYR